jgi:hypothetical protein
LIEPRLFTAAHGHMRDRTLFAAPVSYGELHLASVKEVSDAYATGLIYRAAPELYPVGKVQAPLRTVLCYASCTR